MLNIYHIYILYMGYSLYLRVSFKWKYMETTIQTTRKIIDVENDVLQTIKIAAASTGLSVKKYIEHLIARDAKQYQISIRKNNPSPSNDPWFDNPENMKLMELGSQQLKEGKGREVSLEELKGMLNNGL